MISRATMLSLAFLPLVATAANASCPARVTAGTSASLEAVARVCGVNIEALKAANPGLISNVAQPGTTIFIPRPALPSDRPIIGQPSIRTAPSQVPYATGPSMPTVILPPAQQEIPQQHILRGFGDKPGQLPLPLGHSSPFP
jgi:hypothetical protein